MEEKKLYESEYRFMNLIWDNEPVNSTELVRICGKKAGMEEVHLLYGLKKTGRKGLCEE